MRSDILSLAARQQSGPGLFGHQPQGLCLAATDAGGGAGGVPLCADHRRTDDCRGQQRWFDCPLGGEEVRGGLIEKSHTSPYQMGVRLNF